MKKILFVLLALFFVADIYLIAQGDDRSLRILTKSFLIPLLIAFYMCATKSMNYVFLIGLIFSFLGDVFLLFSWGFLPGLGSFLTAHILYVFAFKNVFKKHAFALIPVLVMFVVGLLWFLFPYLHEMKLPVILYASIISLMLYIAVTTQQKWLIIGAIFFVISDSILSINIFYASSTIREMLVMMTYMVAQFCLVHGMKQLKATN